MLMLKARKGKERIMRGSEFGGEGGEWGGSTDQLLMTGW
jgi:hypothetical protein